MQNTWFELKSYSHIGLPITWHNAGNAISYITNPNKIKSHAFCPFIHNKIIAPKFRKEYDINGNLSHNGLRKVQEPKIRDIYYANHWDANIFAYYSYLLSERYEKRLQEKSLDDVVTAYRKVPKEKGNKCNIDFANDVFEHIREYTKESEEIAVIAFDIKGFFDNLDHKILKKAWADILGVQELPPDHYNVFKAITKFSYVDLNKLFHLFQDDIFVKQKSGKIRKKKIKKIEYLRNQNAVAFCELKDIRIIRKKGLISSNKAKTYGICQGSSISAMLANIYMLEFDEIANNKIKKLGGIYRRYSDDMVVICPIRYKSCVLEFFEETIEALAKLEIHNKKTQIFRFKKQNGKLMCLQEFAGQINHNSHKRNFEYLGFGFNGQYVYLKTATLAQYYRKMKTGVRRCQFYAKTIDNKTRGSIFYNRLYRRYSYIGANPNASYIRVSGTKDKWIKSDRKKWGNFITYAQKASHTINGNKIKHQMKNHWKILNDEISYKS